MALIKNGAAAAAVKTTAKTVAKKTKQEPVAFKKATEVPPVKNYVKPVIESAQAKKPVAEKTAKLPPKPTKSAPENETKSKLANVLKKAVAAQAAPAEEAQSTQSEVVEKVGVNTASLLVAPAVPKKSAPEKKTTAPGTVSFYEIMQQRANASAPAVFDPTKYRSK